MPRPKSTSPLVPMPSRAPASTIEAVATVAEIKKVSPSELIRIFVEEGLHRYIGDIAAELEKEQARQRERVEGIQQLFGKSDDDSRTGRARAEVG